MTTAELETLDDAALRAMQARDFTSARSLLMRAAEIDVANIDRWLKLAAACRAGGDLPAAILAVERGLAQAPRHFHALLMRAFILEKMAHPEAEEAYGIAVGLAPPDEALDPSTLAALNRARGIHTRRVEAMKSFLEHQVQAAVPDLSALDRARTQRFIDDHLRLTKRYRQEPSHFYFPGLPDYEYYDRSLFPWIEAFEAAAPDVLEELNGVLDEGMRGFSPYINYPDHLPVDQWAELNRNPDWGAFHLIQGGQRIAGNADRCPKTMAAIARLPQPQINFRGPSAMFSALQPHTRIPPHTGVSNSRLVVHLPLIIPDSCGFRVGNETREWKPGEAWVFDDTLEHEAWNESDRIRIILIVDVWNPYLTDAQQIAIKAAMEAIDAFSGVAPAGGL